MPYPIALPYELFRTDYELCVDAFRIGRISEVGFRHHLTRLGYAVHELDAEVEHHRTELSAKEWEAA